MGLGLCGLKCVDGEGSQRTAWGDGGRIGKREGKVLLGELPVRLRATIRVWDLDPGCSG